MGSHKFLILVYRQIKKMDLLNWYMKMGEGRSIFNRQA